MNQNNPNPQQQININPEDTTGVACTNCKSEFFIPVYMLRKVSALLSPSGREETVQVPVMACAQCGKPLIPDGFADVSEGAGAEDEAPQTEEAAPETEGDGSRIITS